MPGNRAPLGLNRFFVSEYSRTAPIITTTAALTTPSQSLLRQRILPDEGFRVWYADSGLSQSLLRQRILPDATNCTFLNGAMLSQSLLRQRILPDSSLDCLRPSYLLCLNRFFVSEYSRTYASNCTVSSRAKSQSLLRQRILPDEKRLPVIAAAMQRLNRFFVSEYSRTPRSSCGICRTPHCLNRFFVSEYSRT